MKLPGCLKWAGLMGHEYIVTVPDKDRGERVYAECNSLSSANASACEFTGSRVWRQLPGRKWKLVNSNS